MLFISEVVGQHFVFLELLKKKIPVVTTYHGTYSGNNFLLKKKYNGFMTSGDFTISISKFIDDHIRYFFSKPKKPKLNKLMRN